MSSFELPSRSDGHHDVFGILADQQRRQLLAILQQVETPERLSALIRSLAVATDRSGAGEIERLSIHLYHSHLPTLEDAGLITYDEEQDTIDLTERGRALAKTVDQ